MTILQNYPNASQQSAKINPLFDCVPTSLKDGMDYLTGSNVDIDAMVTAVYGAGWHGGTSAARYVEYCAQHGVHLFPIDGPPGTLVQDLHEEIRSGHPCLLTEPDPYALAHPDWSHVLSVYGEGPGTLTARDPFSTHDVTHPDAVWASILEFREIWVMEALTVQLDISMPAVAALFVEHDATHWKSKATGFIVQDGLLADYKARGQASLDYLGDVVQNEVYIGPGRVLQRYEKGVRCWENGVVSSLDIYDGPAVDPLVGKLEAQITAMQAVSAPATQEHALLVAFAAQLKAVGIS